MKKTLFILLFSSMFMLSATSEYNGESKKELDTTVVVSLKEDTRYSKQDIQDYFYSNLTSQIGFNYRKIDSFTKLTNVVTLKVNSNDIKVIKELPFVTSAYKEIEYEVSDYSIDDPDYSQYSKSSVPTNYSALDMNKGTSKNGENTLVAVIDTSLNYYHEAFNDIDTNTIRYSKNDISSIVSNSDGFHATNYKWINDKVPFSYDYIGDRTSSSPDDDVISTQEHGTHVASIAAGNGKYKGIASEAQIAFFKVFTNLGTGCTTSIYLKALEDAYALDVDAINMSFGSTLLYEDEEEDIAVNELINKMKEEGIECFIASGNDGKNAFNSSIYKFSSLSNTETGSSGSLATNNEGNSVGSFTTKSALNNIYASDGTYSYKLNDRIISRTALSSTSNGYQIDVMKLSKEYRFNDYLDDEIETIFIPNYGSSEDYVGLNCKNKIAVVQRGSITFYAKIDAAMKAGCKGLIICSSKSDEQQTPYFGYELQDSDKDKGYATLTKDGVTYYDYTKINIPVAVISYTDSINLILNAKNNGKLSFYQDDISTFSSQGGDPSLSLKPDFIAPGTNIYGASTVEYTKENGYLTTKKGYSKDTYIFKNGTSMATPNAMGAFVSSLSNNELTSSNRKELRKLTINKLKSNTTILKDSNNTYYSPRIQGAGLLNIEASNNSNSYLTYNNTSKVELKNNEDIKNGYINFDVLFNSLSEDSKEYNVKVTIMSPLSKDIENLGKVVTTSDKKLDTYSFKQTLKNGDKISIHRSLNESIKKELEEFNNGTYIEGYIEVSSNDESLSIPFLGYYGSNYDLIKPFEDFDFEKDGNDTSIIYESDLITKYILNATNKNEDKVNIGSKILVGQDDYNPHSNTYFAYYLRNCNDYTIGFNSKEANYDELNVYYNEDESRYDLYVDSTTSKRGLTIQLFMLKAMKEGKILLDGTPQDDTSINYFIDTQYSSVTKELFKDYIILQSSAFNSSSYTHKTIGYLTFCKEGDMRQSIIEKGKHTLTLEFTTFNNNILQYTYNLYINESYGESPSIYDVTYKDNILTISIENIKELKKVVINESKEIEVNYHINDTECIINIDTSIYNDSTFFTFYNESNKSCSLKYFYYSNLSDAYIPYAYGKGIQMDTRCLTSLDTYYDDNYSYSKKTYEFSNIKSSVSDKTIYFGLYNFNPSSDSLYKDEISEYSKIDTSSAESNYIKLQSTSYKIIKLSNKEEREDKKNEAKSNNLNLVIVILLSILGIFLLTFITIFIILKIKFKRK